MAAVTTLAAIAERVAQGQAIGADEAAVVGASHDLIAIGMMADEVRRRLHGARTTFGRVFEIHADAVPSETPAGVSAGEYRIVGQPASVEAACAAASSARALAGASYVSGFVLSDLAGLGGGLHEACRALASAGLDAVSEVAIDDGDPVEAILAARDAGLRVDRLTVRAAATDVLALVRQAIDIADRAGAVRVFAPLPRTLSLSNPTTGYDDVKAVALARLLARTIPSIQVDWALYGPKLAQVALTVGADDVDAVAAIEPGLLGSRRTALEEIKGNIRAAGLDPVERDGRFEAR